MNNNLDYLLFVLQWRKVPFDLYEFKYKDTRLPAKNLVVIGHTDDFIIGRFAYNGSAVQFWAEDGKGDFSHIKRGRVISSTLRDDYSKKELEEDWIKIEPPKFSLF